MNKPRSKGKHYNLLSNREKNVRRSFQNGAMVADKFIPIETKDPGVRYQKFPEINKSFQTMTTSPKQLKTDVGELSSYQKKILHRQKCENHSRVSFLEKEFNVGDSAHQLFKNVKSMNDQIQKNKSRQIWDSSVFIDNTRQRYDDANTSITKDVDTSKEYVFSPLRKDFSKQNSSTLHTQKSVQ